MDRWARITNSVDDYLVNGVPTMDHALLFNAFPGAGKTRNVLRRVWELGKKFIYLAPDHEVILDNVELHEDVEIEFVHFKGREWECTNQENRELAQQFHMSLRPICEKICADKDTCNYYIKKKKIESHPPPSWAGVHAHIISYLRKYLLGTASERPHLQHFDVMIVEENPMPRLMENRALSLPDIGNIEMEASMMQECNERQLGTFCDVLEYFAAHVVIPHDYDRLWERVEEWRRWDNPAWAKFHDKWEEHITWRIKGVEGEPLRNVPQDIVMLLDDMFQATTRENLQYHVRTISGQVMLNYFYGDRLRDLPMRIMCLDGTANMDTWNHILNKPLYPITIVKPFKNVWQAKGANYPQSSWIRNGELTRTGLALLKLVEKIVKTRDGKILLIGTKKVCGFAETYLMEKNLMRKIRLAHYYNLRSKNFTDCDTVVLLVRPSPTEDSINAYTALSGWPRTFWQSYYTRDEMLQAIARIRPTLDRVYGGMPPQWRNRGEISCFVLCNAGTKDAPEELFHEGDVEGYHQESVPTLEGFIMTGVLVPKRKVDIAREEWIIAALQRSPATEKQMIDHVRTKWTSEQRRRILATLSRMIACKQITKNGDNYELVR